MKINKKTKKTLSFVLVGVFAMALVTAGLLTYYGQVNQNIEVNQPIDFTSTNTLIPCDAGETCDGDLMTIGNDGQHEVDVVISNNAGVGIDVSYIGALELTKKTVDFNLDVWEVLSEKVQIEYTIVGDEFNAEVTTGEISGYVLVYYADNDNRFANPGQAVLVEDVLGNLPGVDDENADLNDYSLEYPTTPFGAKIWYVPLNALTLDVEAYNIDWNRANEFYFESSLIQYNVDGQITVYPGELLDATPRYALDSLLSEGSYWVTTEVLPA